MRRERRGALGARLAPLVNLYGCASETTLGAFVGVQRDAVAARISSHLYLFR